MTEAETLVSLTDMSDTSLSFISVWISVTFAYLTVAYVVGKDLSRFQYIAITTLYLTVCFEMSMAAVTWIQAYEALHLKTATILREVTLANYSYANTATIFFIGGTVLSLYFMYNIRHFNRM